MRRLTLLSVPISVLIGSLWLVNPLLLAQSGRTGQQEEAKPAARELAGMNPYSEANLKFDILESQIQTLRKKMQLQAKIRAAETEEWEQHYEKVKQHIEAWDDFVDSYGIK